MPTNAATLIAAAADIALVVDNTGTIKDIALHGDELGNDIAGSAEWIGTPWIDTVTADSRQKIQEVLRESVDKTASSWRHLNYRSIRGPDIPILFSAIRLEPDRIVAVGRDLRDLAKLQQRLVEAQQSMERDYSRLRNIEMRYRLLFQLSSEPVLIVDTATQKVVEINPATSQLFDASGGRILDRPFAEIFQAQDAPVVIALLAGVRAAGRADDVRVRLGHDNREVFVSAHMFRQERSSFFLVRLSSLEARASEAMVPKLTWKLC